MSPQSIAILLCRITAVVFFGKAVEHFMLALPALLQYFSGSNDWAGTVVGLSLPLASLAPALALWFGGRKIAAAVSGDDAPDIEATVDAAALLAVGIGLIGAWFVASGLMTATYTEAGAIHHVLTNTDPDFARSLDHHTAGNRLRYLASVTGGVVLVLLRHRFASLIQRI